PRFHKKEKTLKFIPLGGIGTVTKNMYVYEYENDILLVDCGIGFPEMEQLGVDVVIPDISHLLDRLNKIKGILITHAHEDHFGALPYLLQSLGRPPIYCAKLARGLIQQKLTEFNLLSGTSLHLIEPETDPFDLGVFRITPIRVNHSVPDTLAFSIKTPVGQIMHFGDFKFDWTPVDGKSFEIGKVATLAKDGVLLLLSDCLGATTAGYTASEKEIEGVFEREIGRAPGQVFVTTLSSNISRIQQAINASSKFGRKVSLLGRSIEQNVETAKNLGYLGVPHGALISLQNAQGLTSERITYIISGCYGQENSALVKLAENQNPFVSIKKNATVIFSADPIPGVHNQVNSVIDKLTNLGARVVYSEIQEGLHTSGHGSIGDLQMLIALTKPSFFAPIGGNPRHMRAYSNLVAEMRYPQSAVFELKNGDTLEISRNKVNLGKQVKTTDVFVDGSRVGDVGERVLKDRKILSEDGIMVVIVKKGEKGQFSSAVDITSRGFVYMREAEKLIADAKKLVEKEISGKQISQWNKVKLSIEDKLSRFLYRVTERNPMIVVMLVD
ncbi:MAG: ribonuclease J, partial [Candidatus Cloacimonetes bacterium]|nr:ribonuclease J [Candidatus Cloacimonadota bacterium]